MLVICLVNVTVVCCVGVDYRKSAEPAEPQLTEEEARQVEEEERKKIEKQEEKRIDDLWSSFKQDTSAKPRPPVAIETSTSSQVATTKAPLQVCIPASVCTHFSYEVL